MARLRFNGLATVLGGSGLTDSATSITFAAALTHSGGTAVPTIGGGDYIPLTILDGNNVPKEIVHLTAYTSGSTTGTVSRGQQSTTGVAHSVGAKVMQSATVSDLTSAFTTYDNTASGASASTVQAALDELFAAVAALGGAPAEPLAYVANATMGAYQSTTVNVPAHDAGDLLVAFGGSAVALQTVTGWTSQHVSIVANQVMGVHTLAPAPTTEAGTTTAACTWSSGGDNTQATVLAFRGGTASVEYLGAFAGATVPAMTGLTCGTLLYLTKSPSGVTVTAASGTTQRSSNNFVAREMSFSADVVDGEAPSRTFTDATYVVVMGLSGTV